MFFITKGYVMTLDQLFMLTTVVDLGNVQAASDQLNKTQPAISKGLKQLEYQLQITLFDRSEYRLKLTSAGKQIYSHAKRVIAEAENLSQISDHIAKGNEIEIVIAIDGIFQISILKDIFKEIQQRYPNTHLIIRQEYLSGAVDAMEKGEVDIAISLKERNLRSYKPQDYIYINTRKLVNVASPKLLKRHPKLKSITELKRECLIMLQDSGSITKGFELGAIDGQNKWYVNDFIIKKQLILDDLGWGKLPDYMVEDALKNGDLVIINPKGSDNIISIEFFAQKNKLCFMDFGSQNLLPHGFSKSTNFASPEYEAAGVGKNLKKSQKVSEKIIFV